MKTSARAGLHPRYNYNRNTAGEVSAAGHRLTGPPTRSWGCPQPALDLRAGSPPSFNRMHIQHSFKEMKQI